MCRHINAFLYVNMNNHHGKINYLQVICLRQKCAFTDLPEHAFAHSDIKLN